MRFSKWHALGNSYLVVEVPDLDAEQAARLCDPSRGIGADGVVQVVTREGTWAEVVIWNSDGSTAEMSGNGTRIAAAWLAAETRVADVTIVSAGREVVAHIGPEEIVTAVGVVDVGVVETIVASGDEIQLTSVSVGNPHAVIRVAEPSRDELLRLGPAVETHPRFPRRTNVQLARPRGRHDVDILVWERGAGETASSGSSAIAVAAVGVAQGWCESPVVVHAPGGDLRVELDSEGHALLAGPAERVCVGETDL